MDGDIRFKQFSNWLIQSVNNSGMGYWFLVYDLSMQLAREFHFPNNTGMSEIIYVCVLLITTFHLHNYPLTSYYLPTFGNANNSYNMTITHIEIFDQINSVPMDLCLHHLCNPYCSCCGGI